MRLIRFKKSALAFFVFHTIVCTVVFFHFAPSDSSHKHPDIDEFSNVQSRDSSEQVERMSRCEMLLAKWNTGVPVMIIDLEFLNEIDKSDCLQYMNKPIKIGLQSKYRSNESVVDRNRFDVVYYTDNSSKDFLDFDVDGRRIIPKGFATRWIGNFEIPNDINRFIAFWNRSKFVNCAGIKVKRREDMEVVMPAQKSTEILARLRDELIKNGMFPFLNSGTLLGWYRECSFIPHTTDMDLAVSYDNYNPDYLKKLENGETQFKIIRRLGMVNDSLEITVIPKKESKPNIDIFLMYDGIENGTITHSYISGLAGDGTKYKFSFPVYDPWCAADLHDHIFWVTCSPKSQILAEHGKYWYLDKPSSTYSWTTSSKNVKPNGKFTAEQMNEVYVEYGLNYYISQFKHAFFTR
ncbi:unnamed protein product [Caenorhabditis brenneri]